MFRLEEAEKMGQWLRVCNQFSRGPNFQPVALDQGDPTDTTVL